MRININIPWDRVFLFMVFVYLMIFLYLGVADGY